MRIIKTGDKPVALLFDGDYAEGTNPLTNPSLPLQALSLKYPKGKIWPLHKHEPKRRVTDRLLETLWVISGKIKVDVYHSRNFVETVTIDNGKGIMTLDGELRVEALEDVVMVEFKNGPFVEDKVVLE